MKIAIVFGNDGGDVRLAKTCRTLSRQGHEVHFIGWVRRPDLPSSQKLPGIKYHLLVHRVPQRRSTVVGQVLFTRHALRSLMLIRPDTVIGVNEDNILRVLPLWKTCYKKLVCDLYDSHIDRLSGHNFLIRTTAFIFCSIAKLVSHKIIATDEARREKLGWVRNRTTVIGNYPEDPGRHVAATPVNGPAKLFVSGTLSQTRGLDTLYKALDQSPEIRVIAAGWIADDFTRNYFIKHEQVDFRGSITPQESLSLAAECDALLTMYAPTCQNNIMASPNKIYDAMSVGRPIIINKEALVSDWVSQEGLGHLCGYYDFSALAYILNKLLSDRASLNSFIVKSRNLFETGYSWEAMDEKFLSTYRST